MAKKPRGRCRICGAVGPLTNEHPIPASAENRGPVSVQSLYSVVKGWARGELFQNGLTRRTLCAACNGACGRHYVRPFASWTLQALVYQQRLDGDSRVLLPFTVLPLAIAKQLAVMTLAMSHAGSIDLPHFLDLRRFVVSPARRCCFDAFKFYAYFHSGAPVFEGFFVALDTAGGPSPTVYCHVGRAPLGYVVTANDDASAAWAAQLRLCDLTRFAFRERHVISVEHLWLPCRRGELPYRARHRAAAC